jgi:hypothetical protein
LGKGTEEVAGCDVIWDEGEITSGKACYITGESLLLSSVPSCGGKKP